MTDDLDQLPESRAWRRQWEPWLNADAYLSEHLSVTTARLFVDLMMPELIEVGGCAIRTSSYEPANFEGWWSHVAGNVIAIEVVLHGEHVALARRAALPRSAVRDDGHRRLRANRGPAQRAGVAHGFVASWTSWLEGSLVGDPSVAVLRAGAQR